MIKITNPGYFTEETHFQKFIRIFGFTLFSVHVSCFCHALGKSPPFSSFAPKVQNTRVVFWINITKVASIETKCIKTKLKIYIYIYSGKEKNYGTKYEERDTEYKFIAY